MFFQNPFHEEFRGIMPAAPATGIGPDGMPTFKCPPHAGRSKDAVLSYAAEPYNLSGNDATGITNNLKNLTLSYVLGSSFNFWNTLTIDLSALITSYGTYVQGLSPNFDPNPSQKNVLPQTIYSQAGQLAVAGNPPTGQTWGQPVVGTITPVLTALKANEVAMLLNSHAQFNTLFTASVYIGNSGNQVMIKQKLPVTQFKFYIANGGAEEVLRFNALAGVAELPEYFIRHAVNNYNPNYNPTSPVGTNANFPDNVGSLVLLTPAIVSNTPMNLSQTTGYLGMGLANAIVPVGTLASTTSQAICSMGHGLQNGYKICVVKSDAVSSTGVSIDTAPGTSSTVSDTPVSATATITVSNGQIATISGFASNAGATGYPYNNLNSTVFNVYVVGGGGTGGIIQVQMPAGGGTMSTYTAVYSGGIVNAGNGYTAGAVSLSNPWFTISSGIIIYQNANPSIATQMYGSRGYWCTLTNYNVIKNAMDSKGNPLGYGFNNLREDYQLLAGTVSMYNFQSVILDPAATATLRPLQIITYPAGAGVGFVAAKLFYYYADKLGAGTDTLPTRTWQVPYVLKQSDLTAPWAGSSY